MYRALHSYSNSNRKHSSQPVLSGTSSNPLLESATANVWYSLPVVHVMCVLCVRCAVLCRVLFMNRMCRSYRRDDLNEQVLCVSPRTLPRKRGEREKDKVETSQNKYTHTQMKNKKKRKKKKRDLYVNNTEVVEKEGTKSTQ